MKATLETIKKRFSPLLKRHDVKRAALFGSIVYNRLTPDSDIDLLIEFRGRKSLFDLVDLQLALEKSIKRKVDLVTYNSLHPLLRDRILKEQTIIYGKKS